MNFTNTDQEHVIDSVYVLIKMLSFIPFGTAYVMSFSYLNSISLAKECLLVYLYKDVLVSMLWWRTFSAIEVIVNYLNAGETEKIPAIMISFGFWLGAMYLALILMFISIYNLYMVKSNTIDPTINWLGPDEVSAIKRIRCGCILVVIGFSAISFGLGLYPNIVYRMTPHQLSGSDLLISNILYRGTLILLLLVSGIFIAARRIYGSTHEIQIDQVFTNSIKYIFIISIITIGILTIAEACQFFDIKTSWKIYQVVMSPIEMFAPFIVILRSDQLKTHSIRFMKNKLEAAFMLSIYLVPACMFITVNSLIYVMFKVLNV